MTTKEQLIQLAQKRSTDTPHIRLSLLSISEIDLAVTAASKSLRMFLSNVDKGRLDCSNAHIVETSYKLAAALDALWREYTNLANILQMLDEEVEW